MGLSRSFRKAEIVGVDVSRDMLKAAAKRVPGAKFREGDAATFDPSGFDLVFANAVFHWVPQHIAAIGRLARALPPGGCSAAQMPDNEDERSHRLMRAVAALPAFAGQSGGGTRERIGAFADYELALSPSCADVDIWRTTYVHRLPSTEDIVKWVEGAGLRPYLDPLDENARAEYSDGLPRGDRRGLPGAAKRRRSVCVSEVVHRGGARKVSGSLAPVAAESAAPFEETYAPRPFHSRFLLRGSRRRVGAGQGHAGAETAAAARTSRRSHNVAKQVFGRELSPTEAQTRSIGFYSHGCLAGGEALPLDGDTWRVMRVSRNRYWGNPETIDFLNASRRRRPTRVSGPAFLSATSRSRAAGRC